MLWGPLVVDPQSAPLVLSGQVAGESTVKVASIAAVAAEEEAVKDFS